jgi:hypothetical protein
MGHGVWKPENGDRRPENEGPMVLKDAASSIFIKVLLVLRVLNKKRHGAWSMGQGAWKPETGERKMGKVN